MIVDQIRKRSGKISYVFTDEATEWEKEAVKEYGVRTRNEVEAALDWREAIDALANDYPKLTRVMRGKHPTKDKEIGRPNNRGPSNAADSLETQ